MKYILGILLLLFSFTSTAQDSSVCMPYTVAKQIAQDLINGDSTKAILTLTNEELSLTKEKIALKDSIINVYKGKEINLLEQLSNERLAKNSYISMYNTLESDYTKVYKQYKKQKFINRIYKLGFWSGLAIGIAGYIILTKPF
jgi:hypothetical protein